jgi:3-deoxy-D-manno-octulosonic acid (KDO) 8-phosphate synthase
MLLAKSATAAGVDSLFIECHPDPSSAASDASTMQPLSAVAEMIKTCASIRQSIQSKTTKGIS